VNARSLEFLIPGDVDSASGGYVYDRSMVAGLRALGWQVRIHTLDASFPSPSPHALSHAASVLAALPDRSCVLIDGLALGAMPQLLEPHARRLVLIALIHMPLAAQFGLPADDAERLRRQERSALRWVQHVVVTGSATQWGLVQDGVDAAKLSLVEPGVWLPQVAGGSATAIGASAVQMLCVATVHDGKGHELLIDALAPLSHIPWYLRCVGSVSRSPAAVQRLVERLQRLGLTGRVALLGEIPHPAVSEWYLAADLFVLPTLRETYCMAVAEALAHGVPVISSRAGAIPELVGAAGLLIEPGDCKGLQAALARALQDSALRASLRAAAHAARTRLTTWPDACEQMARVLERTCVHVAHQA
jgi:glycosyltransferase involved in cell wall biosynthesis